MLDENVCHFVQNMMKLLIALCYALTEIYQILAAIVTMRVYVSISRIVARCIFRRAYLYALLGVI